MSETGKAPWRCRHGRHHWGLWLDGRWHGLPNFGVAGAPRVVCKRCPARGLLDANGVSQIVGPGVHG